MSAIESSIYKSKTYYNSTSMYDKFNIICPKFMKEIQEGNLTIHYHRKNGTEAIIEHSQFVSFYRFNQDGYFRVYDIKREKFNSFYYKSVMRWTNNNILTGDKSNLGENEYINEDETDEEEDKLNDDPDYVYETDDTDSEDEEEDNLNDDPDYVYETDNDDTDVDFDTESEDEEGEDDEEYDSEDDDDKAVVEDKINKDKINDEKYRLRQILDSKLVKTYDDSWVTIKHTTSGCTFWCNKKTNETTMLQSPKPTSIQSILLKLITL
jgi:hypothetical protein